MQTRIYHFFQSLSAFKWGILTCFFILALIEVLSGPLDVASVMAPLLFCLLLVQLYQSADQKGQKDDFRLELKRQKMEGAPKLEKVKLFFKFIFLSIKNEVFAKSPELSKHQKALKLFMNNLFLLMVVLVVFSNFFSPIHQEIQLASILIWSIAFLALNIREFMKSLSYARLIMVNIGIFFVLGSLTLVIL